MSSWDAVPDDAIVAGQLGRVPRGPWRVGRRCVFGYPQVIVSPSLLEDGTPFPNLVWLTCPWVSAGVSAMESDGDIARWNERISHDPELDTALRVLDASVRAARALESGGTDTCATVGLAGQRDPSAVKCLHAHAALALMGFSDPIGAGVLGRTGDACADARCQRLVSDVAVKERP